MTRKQPLFHRLYGDAVTTLPRPITDLHDVGQEKIVTGRAKIETGTSPLAKLVCRLFAFPPATEATRLKLTMRANGVGEDWERQFGEHRLASKLKPSANQNCVEETLGAVTAVSRMEPDSEGVTQTLIQLRMLGIQIPKLLWPRLKVRETASSGRYMFSMALYTPWNSLIVRYEGWLDPTRLALRPSRRSQNPGALYFHPGKG